MCLRMCNAGVGHPMWFDLRHNLRILCSEPAGEELYIHPIYLHGLNDWIEAVSKLSTPNYLPILCKFMFLFIIQTPPWARICT
jgi:hypothetical protein